MSPAPEKRSYVARIFGSLANTLLDLGLPRIRAWLRDRVGPEADVAQVTADGPLIHLDGVLVPLGPRGRLVLDRATAAIAPSIGARLHQFRGELVFGARGAPEFRAEISFNALPDPDDGAWISGELRVERASWTSGEGAPAADPMTGAARLFVTSSAWRLEHGRLENEHASVSFEGRGSLERESEDDAKLDALLVPRAVRAAKLILQAARVGPFVDAMIAIGGRAMLVPPFVPRDARLFGEIAWSAEDGASSDLRVDSDAVTATLRGTVSSSGADLKARLEAELRPTVTLRALGLDPVALPRDEDVARVEIDATGDARSPTLRGSVRSAEIGFRFGRPRFVPAGLLLRDVAIAIASAGPRIHVDVGARAVRGKLTATVDGELTATLEGAVATEGKVTLATSRSALSIAPLVRGRDLAGTRIEGRVALDDLVDAGILVGTELRARGEVDVNLAVADADGDTQSTAGQGAPSPPAPRGSVSRELRGTIASARVALEAPRRPEIGLVDLRDVRGEIVVGPQAVRWRALEFTAFQGRFRADGIVRRGAPTESGADEVSVRFEDAGASLVELASRAAESRVPVRAARAGTRPDDEAWIDPATTLSGEARLLADRSIVADVTLKTPAGSAVVASLVVANDRLDGSKIRGDVALADMLLAGAFEGAVHPVPDGAATIDAELRGDLLDPVLTGWIATETLRLGIRESGMDALIFHDVRALFRVDGRTMAWHRLEARAYDGVIRSAGVVDHAEQPGRVVATLSLAAVQTTHLPIPDGKAGALVRGLLGGWIRFDRKDARSATVGAGYAELAHGEFPLLGTSRAVLSRYGLSALPERAIAPATVRLGLSDGRWSFSSVRARVQGASIAGDLLLARDGELAGSFVVTLEDDYLRSSAILVLPSMFAERLTVPMQISGTLAVPRVDADLAGALNRFVSDNHISTFVTDLFRVAGRPAPLREPERHDDVAAPAEPITHDTDWSAVELRLNEYRRRRGDGGEGR